MGLRLSGWVLLFLGLAGTSQPAVADPITSWYQVTVNRQATPSTGWLPTAIDPISFLMAVTFDDTVTWQNNEVHSRWSHFQNQAPTFTGFPESIPSWDYRSGAAYVYNSDEAGTSEKGAVIYSSTYTNDGRFTRYYGSQLSNRAGTLEGTSVDTLLRTLAVANFHHYRFNIDEARGTYLADSFQMFGTATQIPDPVPEPGTMTLFGVGIAATAWRARRRRSSV